MRAFNFVKRELLSLLGDFFYYSIIKTITFANKTAYKKLTLLWKFIIVLYRQSGKQQTGKCVSAAVYHANTIFAEKRKYSAVRTDAVTPNCLVAAGAPDRFN